MALAAAAGVTIENARLFEAARRQERWLRDSAEVTGRLLGGVEADEVLEFVTQQTREMTGADLVVLALPSSDHRQLTVRHAAGDGAQQALGLALPAEASVSGEVLDTGQPVTVEHFRHDERVAKPARVNLDLGPAVAFPLGSPGNVRGVLTVGRQPGSMPLPQAAVELVTSFAAQAGIALELAEHRKEAERLAVLEDRERIAWDLHDVVIQRLYASGMKLQGTLSLIDRPEAAQRASSVVDDLDATIKDIRAAIFTLQEQGGRDHPSLRAQIAEVVQEMTGALGMSSELRLDGRLDSQIPGGIAVAGAAQLLRAVIGTLTLFCRHDPGLRPPGSGGRIMISPARSSGGPGTGTLAGWVLGQDVPEPGDEAQRLVMLALPDVAAEDQAGGAGRHRLARLLEHRLVPGPLSSRDQQQRPVRRSDHRVDGLLR